MDSNESDVASAKLKPPHEPDPTRLPQSVGQWLPMDLTQLWNDGTQLLVAVPVCSRIPNSRKRDAENWYYEYSVVVIRCDEDYFAVETGEGDDWGWELDCVDFFIVLSK